MAQESSAKPDPAAASGPPAPPQGDWPARPASSTPVKQANERRKRGPWFGALILLGVLAGLPLLAYLGVLAYVKLGFLESRINRELSTAFGDGAGAARLSTSGLEGLRLEGLRVPATDRPDPPAAAAEAVTAEWDLWALASSERIRSIHIHKPKLDLRRDASGAWNIKLPSGGKPSSVVIEQIDVREGALALGYAPDRTIALDEIAATWARPDAPLPASGTLEARWPSGQKLNGALNLGPGWNASLALQGGVEPSKDLAGALPPELKLDGALRFDLNARHTANESGGGKLELTALLTAQDMRYPLGPDLALRLDRRTVELRGAGRVTAQGVPPVLDDFEVRVERAGRVGGRLELLGGERYALDWDAGRVAADLAALRGLFEPRLGGEAFEVDGTLEAEQLTARIPLDGAWPAARFAGTLRLPGVRVTLPEFGTLPVLDASFTLRADAGRLELKDATVALGDVARAAFSASAAWKPPEPPILELLRGAQIADLELDAAKFLATPFGRELVARRLPPAWVGGEELALAVQGRLLGKDLKATSADTAGVTRVALEGLEARGLEVTRWPLEWPLPGRFDGTLGVEARIEGGALRAAALRGTVRSNAAEALEAAFALEAGVDAEGRFRPHALKLEALRAPLNELARLCGIDKLLALKWAGSAELTKASYDLESGAFEGAIRLDGAGLDSPLNIAGMNIAKLKNVAAVGQIRRENGQAVLSGRIASAELFLLMLNLSSGSFPVDYAARVDLEPRAGQGRALGLDLAWQGGSLKLAGTLEVPEPEVYRARGRLETSWLGGTACVFDLTYDSANRRVGPLVLTFQDVDLERMRGYLQSGWIPEAWRFGGVAPELRLRVEPFVVGALADLLDLKFPISGRVSGSLKNGWCKHAPSASEAAKLSGTFALNFARELAAPSLVIGLAAQFDGYEALILRDVYVPPPAAGQRAAVQCAARIVTEAGIGTQIRLDKLAVDLAGLLTLEADGRVHLPPGGNVLEGGEGLVRLRAGVPDLARAHAALGEPNLKVRFPALAAGRYSGGANYEGTHVWSRDTTALSGSLRLRGVSAALAGERPFEVRELQGEIPLSFYLGLWPSDWARERRSTLTAGELRFPPLRAGPAPLALIATPNELRLANALSIDVPGGKVLVENFRARDLLGTEPALEGALDVTRIGLGELAAQEGFKINGLQGAVVSGRLARVALRRRAEPIGSWELAAQGELTAPVFSGTLRAGGLYARGLFGSSPVWGLERVALEDLNFRNLTKANPQMGRLKTIANVAVTDFTATGLGLEDVQSFAIDVDSSPRADKDDSYDGRFAYVLAPEMVTEAAQRNGLSVERIADLTFGIEKIGLRFTLAGGKLAGPLPKLSGGLVLKGAGLFSPDVSGQSDRVSAWSDTVRFLRERAKQLKGIPVKEGAD